MIRKRAHKGIQAVIFDFDDTLIDWSKKTMSWEDFNKRHANYIHNFLRSQGHQMPSRELFSSVLTDCIKGVWADAKIEWRGARFQDALQRCFDAMDVKLKYINLNMLLHAYRWAPMPGVIPFPDTHQVLQTLEDRDYKLGLITNSFLPMWMRDIELRHYNLIDKFPHRITSGDTRYMKPHPAIFWRMLGMLHIMPERAVFVGDRLDADVLGANEVGMTSVWMKLSYREPRLVNGVEPDYTITSLSELIPILESLD